MKKFKKKFYHNVAAIRKKWPDLNNPYIKVWVKKTWIVQEQQKEMEFHHQHQLKRKKIYRIGSHNKMIMKVY